MFASFVFWPINMALKWFSSKVNHPVELPVECIKDCFCLQGLHISRFRRFKNSICNMIDCLRQTAVICISPWIESIYCQSSGILNRAGSHTTIVPTLTICIYHAKGDCIQIISLFCRCLFFGITYRCCPKSAGFSIGSLPYQLNISWKIGS